MDQTPLVTIITPSYNQAQYLEAAIQSVLTQDYPRIEYMIVDGGSKDGSVDIIRAHADRLTWWVSERDSGQAEAINKGFARATGEIVGWVNSDDLLLPGAVSAAVRAFGENSTAGLVYANQLAIDADGNTTNLMRYGAWGLDDLMRFRMLGQPAVYMRRDALLKAGFMDPTLNLLLDHELWIRMAREAPMVYVNQVWAASRYHPAAKNRSQARNYGKDAARLVEWMQTQPVLSERFQANRRKILAGAQRFDAFYLLDGGAPREALGAYGRSFWLHPPTALADTHRILYALASLVINPTRLRAFYEELRRRRVERKG